ncbi:MAG: hypothetical protein NC187_00100 [Candidatus Amulumruptor caecigallinarius]|nr:hypothetical protein [Candidatus Amulumruptor caecigallinarius]MCM1395877.1 hypothetical protein [Candidatus Amulumruptor caecigallinarius]MCM1452912.1 hypothetical protein [bacterium]
MQSNLSLPSLAEMTAENIRRNEQRRAREAEAVRSMVAAPEEPAQLIEAMREDFELWASRCVTIRHKLTGRLEPLRLNAPQRRVVQALERQRRAGRPIRLILLKARQWGGSTVIQMYMAWIQCMHRENWHSFICAHVKDTSATIRGMYSRMLAGYPSELWEGDEKPEFRGYERSQNTRMIAGRGCLVTVSSCESQEAARGNDVAMAHLSEVAFWRDSITRSPADFVRSVCSGIAMEPLTFIAMESTANGVGNFFHTEWLRAKAGESAFTPVFVPWYEIEQYRLSVIDPAKVRRDMTDYDRALWHKGLTLEQIAWYQMKRRELPSAQAMMAEYPSDDVEAFTYSGDNVFDRDAVEALRPGCRTPHARGEVVTDGGVRFVADSCGKLDVWEWPDDAPDDEYVVTVDVGGRSASADWSVIAVMARGGGDSGGSMPRVAAQWRGHIDHDLLVKKAVALARFYRDALLVVESNTLEQGLTDGGAALFMLERVNEAYHNVYRRRRLDTRTGMAESRVGFHTNASTKPMVVMQLVGDVRESRYVERDERALNEMLTYERRPNGSYGARDGHHDDILMTRAIGLYVMATTRRSGDRAAAEYLAGRPC